MENKESILCPSSRAQKGARLLGIRQADGQVAILPQPLLINDAFIEAASKHSPAEQQFRFTNKCVESGCRQWTGSRCTVADSVLSVMNELAVSNELPACAIRQQCRWFNQNGADSCKVCSFVITATTSDDWQAMHDFLTAE